MSIPISKYKCMNPKCEFQFERETPQQVICPKCKSNYVTWVNSKEVLKWIHSRHDDFKKYRE